VFDDGLFTETHEAHALYQYAQTVADVMEVDMPTVDDSYHNVDCELSDTSFIVTVSLLLLFS